MAISIRITCPLDKPNKVDVLLRLPEVDENALLLCDGECIAKKYTDINIGAYRIEKSICYFSQNFKEYKNKIDEIKSYNSSKSSQ